MFLFFYRFYRGGAPFSSTISAVKTVKVKNFVFLPFLPGGAPFSSTISAVKTVKIENFFCLPFFLRGRERIPLSKTTLANQLSRLLGYLLLVAMPFVTSSVLAPSSTARSYYIVAICLFAPH